MLDLVLHVLEVAEEGEILVNLWMKRAIGVAALAGGAGLRRRSDPVQAGREL
jgi:hypothetical protein